MVETMIPESEQDEVFTEANTFLTLLQAGALNAKGQQRHVSRLLDDDEYFEAFFHAVEIQAAFGAETDEERIFRARAALRCVSDDEDD